MCSVKYILNGKRKHSDFYQILADTEKLYIPDLLEFVVFPDTWGNMFCANQYTLYLVGRILGGGVFWKN